MSDVQMQLSLFIGIRKKDSFDNLIMFLDSNRERHTSTPCAGLEDYLT